ncbi:MAG: hypothetical protein KDA89_22300, partial [Planctomycetaceae bacterium]|nr:hypothetical protein [Planctomycetaceae bacterium]
EVQQQSNLTFRLYDWGRVGSDGKPRQIHIAESLACTDFSRGPVNPVTPQSTHRNGVSCERLVECPYFDIHRYQSAGTMLLQHDDRFRILMVVQGSARLSCGDKQPPATLPIGTTLLVPAESEPLEVTLTDAATLLEVSRPA